MNEVTDTDETLPAAEACVLRAALERHAATRPHDTYAVFEDGAGWRFADTLAHVRVTAAGLQRLGVGQDDHVLITLPNGALGLRAMFAANYIGAVMVPVNTAYRGALLEHVVTDSGARVAIVHPDCLDRVLALPPGTLSQIVVAVDTAPASTPAGIQLHYQSILLVPGAPPLPPTRLIAPWDTQAIIFTSGTTGRSKGMLASYMHSYTAMNPATWTCTRADDRHLLHMPIFHIGGALIASMALCGGASVAVVDGFRTDRFWPTVRWLEVTSAFLLGAMATFLLKQPPAADDREHPLRAVMSVPLGQAGSAFHARLGVDVFRGAMSRSC
jgi:crotonobetaine/carnitine-CoA ligase